MALSDVERNRKTPLETATVDRLAREYRQLSAQYPLFSEAPSLSDKTILAYLDTTHAINQVRDNGLKSDSAGMVQALASLWQIFVRQGSIPEAESDAALAEVLTPFSKIAGQRELFDAARAGVKVLLNATHSPANLTPQDRMIDLLAGTGAANSTDSHQQIVEDMIRIFEAQRLVSLTTLFELADNLESVARGEKLNTTLAGKLAS